MLPSEVLRELHESIQREKRLLNRVNRRLRLIEAVKLGLVADQLTDAQWQELDADSDDGEI